jgi:hypothetical protein
MRAERGKHVVAVAGAWRVLTGAPSVPAVSPVARRRSPGRSGPLNCRMPTRGADTTGRTTQAPPRMSLAPRARAAPARSPDAVGRDDRNHPTLGEWSPTVYFGSPSGQRHDGAVARSSRPAAVVMAGGRYVTDALLAAGTTRGAGARECPVERRGLGVVGSAAVRWAAIGSIVGVRGHVLTERSQPVALPQSAVSDPRRERAVDVLRRSRSVVLRGGRNAVATRGADDVRPYWTMKVRGRMRPPDP